MGEIIGAVRVAPSVVRPWEPVRVEVVGPDGLALPAGTEVWIGQARGAEQWLQLPAGRHGVAVTARRDGTVEVEEAAVVVEGEPLLHVDPTGARRPAVLCASPSVARPHEITITLSTPAPPRRAADPEPARRTRRRTRSRARQAARRFELVTDPARQLPAARWAEIRAAVSTRGATSSSDTTYHWDLGDGTTIRTDIPTVVHDYTGRFDLRRPASSFDVRCRVERSGDAPFEVVRTLVIESWYAACRQQGRIVCPVEAPPLAVLSAGVAQGRFRVTNPEDEPLTFTGMAVVPLQVEEPRGWSPDLQSLEEPVVVPGRGSATMVVLPALDELPDGSIGYSVLLTGTAPDGTPARATAVVELPLDRRSARPVLVNLPDQQRRPWPWEEVTGRVDEGLRRRFRDDPVLLQAAADAEVQVRPRARLVAVSLPAPDRTVSLPAVGPHLDALLDEVAESLTIVTRDGTFPPTDPVAAGGRCDPDNIPAAAAVAAESASLACQLAEQEEARVSGRFVNARKGDIILSDAGFTPMAQLYRDMTPPQRHSHAGIMTRNFDEIAHCIGSADWLATQLRRTVRLDTGLPLPIEEVPAPDLEAIRFGWPGAVVQHAEDSVIGELFTDPNGDTFTITGIQPYAMVEASMVVTTPLVVKPDPLLETPALRARLVRAADDAAAASGRPGGVQGSVHFSFFTFTNGAFATPAPVRADGAFPSGTLPGACSPFIWRVLRGRGVVFERGNLDPALLESGDLEPGDLVPARGGEVVPGGVDGLYRYRADERITAGSRLKASMVHAVDESHWGPDWITHGLASAVADLFLNTIAFNSIEIGERWREEPTEGETVSPDDMLFWDGPATGGSYGFAEPLLYREPRTEMVDVYRWTSFQRRHRVSGEVRFAGRPAPRADVTCGAHHAFTDAAGRYELLDVPEGTYPVKARATVGSDAPYGASPPILVDRDRVVDVELHLPLDERRREVIVVMAFFGIDDEVGADEHLTRSGERRVRLNPDAPTKNLLTKGDPFLTLKWGGECRAEYRVTVSLLVDLSVRVDIHGDFFEGTYEDTTELEASFDGAIVVKKDRDGTGFVHLFNDGGDAARLDLHVFNRQDGVE